MNDLLEKLAGSVKRTESSEHLQLLAKRAASSYSASGAESLTAAVQDAVSSEDLNKDQVRRVTEMANQATWRTMFTDGGDRGTQFAPADASAVLEGLSEQPREVTEVPTDYLNDPPGERVPDDLDLNEIFSTKDDGEKYEKLNPAVEEEIRHEKAASAANLARHGADVLLPELHAVGEEFYNIVKQACIRDNNGILQISKAVGQVVESEKFAQSVMETTLAKMKAEGVKFDMKKELSKSARAVVVNTDHPLLVAAVKFEKIAQAYNRSVAAHKELEAVRREEEAALRNAAMGG